MVSDVVRYKCRFSASVKEFEERIANLNTYFTYQLYQSVCRALFEKHKTMFSFSFCLRLLQGDGKMDDQELRFLLTGPLGDSDCEPNPAPEWISGVMWNEICTLDKLPAYEGLVNSYIKHPQDFRKVYDTSEAHLASWPNGWNEKLHTFQKLCLLRCIRMDKIVPGIVNFIIE